jgi:hypothetical protein
MGSNSEVGVDMLLHSRADSPSNMTIAVIGVAYSKVFQASQANYWQLIKTHMSSKGVCGHAVHLHASYFLGPKSRTW